MTATQATIDALQEKLDRAVKYKAISLQIAVEDIQNVMQHIQTIEGVYREEPSIPTHIHQRNHAQHYVLGLLFRGCYSGVVLIEKTKPQWQAGLLNGIGGKVEPGESAFDAATRELREELDVSVTAIGDVLLSIDDPGSQFVIEFYRGDERGAVGMLSTSQFISALLVPLAVLMLIYLGRTASHAAQPQRAGATA